MAALDYPSPVRVHIMDDAHAVIASQQAYRLAGQLGFSTVEQTALSIAVLEVARNIVKYAGSGDVEVNYVRDDLATEVIITAEDRGPGIPDIEQAMVDGFSTGKSLGLGLPGARRLMGTFEITSTPGQGTTVIMRKTKHESG